MKTKNLLVITTLFLSLGNSFAKSGGGDGDGGGGPKITKGVFFVSKPTQIKGDMGGGFVIQTENEYHDLGVVEPAIYEDISSRILVRTTNNDYILNFTNPEELDFFIDSEIGNEKILSILIMQ